ncbi:Capsule polysaccharide biosynthesis protein [Pseudovibrio ascidiaceicola]|uniref:Capsule polysaccharide biosynthesis protein n=1 Tax=Pseudovibrio ascidiaceicola TaxID=285279 RepID=A0A1I3VGT9_9HYPH|nr:hypothetical protein [Pseudovibrio ascidiaceicola]SFJ94402.1 Capsule polysaccharide biosynthesis protein [Pseudovibrio ascidiaceicola]
MQIAIFSSGLWQNKHEIAQLTGLNPVFCRAQGPIPANLTAICGWGYKESAITARKIAADLQLPYWAIEDGFIRAIMPGIAEPSISMLVDRSRIFYDSTLPSDLHKKIALCSGESTDKKNQAQHVIDLLTTSHITKYNNFDPDVIPECLNKKRYNKKILVIDQTFGDAAISGAGASLNTFVSMVNYALENEANAEIIIKTHPDVAAGLKRGLIDISLQDDRVTLLTQKISPWRLFEYVSEVHTVSSQLGLEAVLFGHKVHCWGQAFYSGWGLTTDHFNGNSTPRVKQDRHQLAKVIYLDYLKYFDHWNRELIDFDTAIDQIVYLREKYLLHPYKVYGFLPRLAQKALYTNLFRPKKRI